MKNKCNILILSLWLCFLFNLEVLAKDCEYPFEDQIALAAVCGYHLSDDKSDFWIPQNVNPLLMTNQELEKYRILKNTTQCSKNPFCRYYIKQAKAENRPLIRSDISKANADYADIYGYYGLDASLRDKNGRLGQLTSEQEKTLKKLQDKYGEDSEIFDEEFRQLLKLYRQRQQTGVLKNKYIYENLKSIPFNSVHVKF